jgi:hypothetical protein
MRYGKSDPHQLQSMPVAASLQTLANLVRAAVSGAPRAPRYNGLAAYLQSRPAWLLFLPTARALFSQQCRECRRGLCWCR